MTEQKIGLDFEDLRRADEQKAKQMQASFTKWWRSSGFRATS